MAGGNVAVGRKARLPGGPREGTGVRAIVVILRSARSRASVRLLVRLGEPAVADDVRDQDRRALAALAHPSGTPALRMSSMIRSRPFRKAGLSLWAPSR
jgi:hypothetical protein